jgi:AmiR/NasT family two-component response regulator
VHQATVARDLIEQAKGVLSELHVSDMEQAMARLEEVAKLERVSLPDAAQRVIARASASRTS